jgi:caffeoyl-CoA O-methyltransferase
MELVDPAIVVYAEEHTTAPPSHLTGVHASTREGFEAWGMMVGRQEGRFLEMMVFAAGAARVLEIGTFTGYSSIAMAAGLPPGGTIVTCEVDEHHAQTARRNIAASPYADRITVEVGPAIETLQRLSGPFDLVFIDADKVGYDPYYEAVLTKLAPRGIILFDNTLMDGTVLSGTPAGPGGEAMRRFNEKLVNDPRVVCVLTTIRDGVTVVRRADA